MEKRTPATIDAYLANVPEPARAALEKLRAQIRAAAPRAEEAIAYQIPTFKMGTGLVAFAAFKKHCSFFPMSTAVTDTFAKELASFRTSKGTLQFTPEKPLPAALVKKIVKARLAEEAARKAAKAAKPKR